MSWPQAVAWLGVRLADALHYAHRRGVLHRDIKPANLLLDRDRVLHVADFGIARLGTEDTITATGQVLGTASYLAPERAMGRPATDASDRYSLAVAAYELLVGERPFTATHFAVQARQHVEDDPPAASERNRALPPAVDAVLARGMAKRPEQRWPTAQDFAQALEAALTEPATRSFRTAAVPGPSGRPTRRMSPAPVAAGIAAADRRGAAAADRRSTRSSTAGRTASVPPVATRRPRRRGARIPALAALAAGLAVVAAVAAGAIGSGGGHSTGSTAAAQRPVTQAHHKAVPARPKAPAAQHTASTVTATQAAATTPPPVADTLEARGHQLMLNGNYSAAIPVLRQAVAAAPHSSLTYAYALFDLGRTLRLAGDPKDAVAVLYQRLQIPNQTETVREQLQLALQALGQSANQNGGAGTPTPAPAPGDNGPAGAGDRHHGHDARGLFPGAAQPVPVTQGD
jgi:serine/threonine-protein kinase